jgi:hypothetical protein
MVCERNPYSPYTGCCAPPPASCYTTLCPCGPTGPTGPANPAGGTSFAVGYFTAAATAVPATAGFFIPFNVFTARTSPSYLIGTGAFQAPSTGYYQLSPTVTYAFLAAGSATTSLMQNGVARLQSTLTATAAGTQTTAFSTVLLLNAGDIVQIQGQASGAGVATLPVSVFPSASTSLSVLPLA